MEAGVELMKSQASGKAGKSVAENRAHEMHTKTSSQPLRKQSQDPQISWR